MKKVMMIDPDEIFGGSRRGRDYKDYDELKAYRKIHRFLRKEKERNKEMPKHWWHKKSVGERTVLIMFIFPPLGVAYVFGLLMLAKGMAAVVGVH